MDGFRFTSPLLYKEAIMTKNKYIYSTIIQANYGYGWEDVDTVDENNSAKFLLEEYSMACPQASHRVINRRELN